MLRRVSWSRWVAVFLLLWGVCDLTVPGICKTDFTDLQAIAVQTQGSSHGNGSHPQVLQVMQQSQDPMSSPAVPNSDSDDCWCCCSHIVTPHSGIALIAFHNASDSPLPVREEAPTWRASELFQPPKI